MLNHLRITNHLLSYHLLSHVFSSPLGYLTLRYPTSSYPTLSYLTVIVSYIWVTKVLCYIHHLLYHSLLSSPHMTVSVILGQCYVCLLRGELGGHAAWRPAWHQQRGTHLPLLHQLPHLFQPLVPAAGLLPRHLGHHLARLHHLDHHLPGVHHLDLQLAPQLDGKLVISYSLHHLSSLEPLAPQVARDPPLLHLRRQLVHPDGSGGRWEQPGARIEMISVAVIQKAFCLHMLRDSGGLKLECVYIFTCCSLSQTHTIATNSLMYKLFCMNDWRSHQGLLCMLYDCLMTSWESIGISLYYIKGGSMETTG